MSSGGHWPDLPESEPCPDCGHPIRHYIRDNEGVRMKSDVIERRCPHRNGTVTEHCPVCDRRVGMWGVGVAVMMDCECWD